ncbi:MAG TPA: sulfotransferase [Acidimicrobiales bacterium]|nr:sulfotransferase [Acidimicrobiales bacterium]
MSAARPTIRRKLRNYRRRAARRWHFHRSSRGGFVEWNRDYRRTLLLVSSARSGSTWLSDILEESLRCRMIFEPLRRDKVPLAQNVPWGMYSDPSQPDPELDAVLRRMLSGRVRNRWSDKFNRYRLTRRRLVKEVRATNLLPRIVENFPDMPIVYLLRHPIPTAWSAAKLHWLPYLKEFFRQPQLMEGPMAPMQGAIDDTMADKDLFQRHVLRWCLENYIPVNHLATGSVHVVFYEDIVQDPDKELDRLRAYLGRFPGHLWTMPPQRPAAVDLPSRANYRETPLLPVEQRLGSWRDEVPEDRIRFALDLVTRFGLDRIYDLDVRPRVGVDDVLLGP